MNESKRILLGRAATPSVMVLDGRTLQSAPKRGYRVSWDGAKLCKGSKAHITIERARVDELCRQV